LGREVDQCVWHVVYRLAGGFNTLTLVERGGIPTVTVHVLYRAASPVILHESPDVVSEPLHPRHPEPPETEGSRRKLMEQYSTRRGSVGSYLSGTRCE
jgi:hypothetical protein